MSLVSQIADLAAAVRNKINAMMPRLLPPGGATGQIVTKAGAGDYVFGWADAPAGGGGGTVILDGNGTGPGPAEFILDGNGT